MDGPHGGQSGPKSKPRKSDVQLLKKRKKKKTGSKHPVAQTPETPEAAALDVSESEGSLDEDEPSEQPPVPPEAECLPHTRLSLNPVELLKDAQELLDKVLNQKEAVAAPVADIGLSWLRVAWLSLVTMLLAIPGASILVMPFMFWFCGWRRWHLLHFSWQDLLESGWRRIRIGPVVNEFSMWYILFLSTVADVFWIARAISTWLSKEVASLRPLIEEWQSVQFSAIYSHGLFLLWRILSIHIIEVSAQVHWHKCRELKTLSTLSNSSTAIVNSFILKFRESWHVERCRMPSTLWMIRSALENTLSRKDRAMLFSSALAILASVVLQQFRVFQLGDLSSGPVDRASWAIGFAIAVGKASVSSLMWLSIISGIMLSTRGVKRNQLQLLLFSCIASGSIEYLSAPERAMLEEEGQLDDAFKERYLHVKGSLKNARFVSVRSAAPTNDHFESLVLENIRQLEDVEAWWAVRRFIQIDFKDESARMDACGVILLFLLLGFLVSGIVEWSLHSDPFAPTLLVLLIPSPVLIFVMFRVFDVCIGINTILDRDTLFLTEAMLKALQERTRVISALQAIERRLSVYDDKLKLLGLTVTANLRNGWVASLVVALFSWGSRYVTPVLSLLDVDSWDQFLNQSDF